MPVPAALITSDFLNETRLFWRTRSATASGIAGGEMPSKTGSSADVTTARIPTMSRRSFGTSQSQVTTSGSAGRISAIVFAGPIGLQAEPAAGSPEGKTVQKSAGRSGHDSSSFADTKKTRAVTVVA